MSAWILQSHYNDDFRLLPSPVLTRMLQSSIPNCVPGETELASISGFEGNELFRVVFQLLVNCNFWIGSVLETSFRHPTDFEAQGILS